MPRSRTKVLLVDDDRKEFILIEGLLDQVPDAAIDLDWVTSLDEATKAIETGSYAAVLVDYHLGIQNGLDLIRRTHQKLRFEGLPLILMTGCGDFDLDEQAMAAGAAEYLDKNALTPTFLERTVRHAIQRARGETTLRQTEQFNRSILDALSAHVAVLDETGTIIAVNRSWEEFARANGALPDRVGVGINYVAICEHESNPPEDLDRSIATYSHCQGDSDDGKTSRSSEFANGIRDVLEGRREHFELEYPCHSADRRRWFVGRVTPLRSGIRAGAVVAHEDVTERVLSEEALRRSEESLRTLIDAIPQMVWITDSTGALTYANQRCFEYFGVNAQGEKGWGWLGLIHPDDLETVKLRWLEAVSEGKAYEVELRLKGNDGSYRWHLNRALPLRGDSGQIDCWFGTCTDIDGRKRAEGEIHRLNDCLQRRLRQIEGLHRIDEAIASNRDLCHTLSLVVDQACSQLGVHAAVVLLFDEISGNLEAVSVRGVSEQAGDPARFRMGNDPARRIAREACTLHLPDLLKVSEMDVAAPWFAASGFVTYHGIPLRAKGRTIGVFELLSRTHLVPDAEWLAFVETLAGQAAVAIENASLLEGLRNAHAELITAYEATIEGWARALDLRDKETEGHSRRVTEMTVQVARALGMSESELVHIRRGALLHDIGKMGIPDSILLKPGPLTDEELTVMRRHPELAVEMLWPIEFLRPALEIPHYHHEKWDGTGYPKGLVGEAIPLSARIFAAVDISRWLSSDRPYRHAWRPERVRSHLETLSGSHLDPKVTTVFLEMLGEFSRGSMTKPGIKMTTASTPRGTPALPLSRIALSHRDDPGHTCHRHLPILLVEDDPGMARALGRTLESMGHMIVSAHDGQEAWKLFQEGGIRMVIADWNLPFLNGLELCQRIRELSGRSYTYILLLTGKGGTENRLEGLNAGADDFLVKPFNIRELAARLQIAASNPLGAG